LESECKRRDKGKGREGKEEKRRDKCCQVSVVSAFIIKKKGVERVKAIAIENQRKVKRNENP